MKLLKDILETVIGKFSQTISVTVTIDKSNHASERQFRHGVGSEITDDDIVKTGKRGSDKVTKLLLFNKIDINDEIVLYDPSNKLNLVCQVKNPSPNVIDLRIITVMQKQDFRPKSGTPKIVI